MGVKRLDPKHIAGVMVSSTFTDLRDHRLALIKAIARQDLHALAMENASARSDLDVLDSSLELVAKSSAYIGVISHRYGQVPNDARRNPERLSLTELEFREATRLGRPILLFLMGPDHAVKPVDIEIDPDNRQKLEAFRETAKRFHPDSEVPRVYRVFNDFHEFEVVATQSIAELRRTIEERHGVSLKEPDFDAIPQPPAFYAEPPFIGSHLLVGRKVELETLSEWAQAASKDPILLFDAIGGTGKSLLAWEWINQYSTGVRPDWAGRFWYSFYERGAFMADFCRHALAYMTGGQPEAFQEIKTSKLGELLLRHLRSRPWLLVLDGLERALVSYHRLDAAQVCEEEADTSDLITQRDLCSSIRPDDDDLLLTLAAALPSKLLISSRLVPRVLLNASSQTIPGVLRVSLQGLSRTDAEAMFRACGVTGDGTAMQGYLQDNFDCHPLVIGALAGLIVTDYLSDRGNFDSWAKDPEGSRRLELSRLNLVRRRNHIVQTALEDLPEKSSDLLSTLALFHGSVDFATLEALNPYLKRGTEPQSSDVVAARELLSVTVRDLERRGLLQYDPLSKRHDLHPVVRSFAVSRLDKRERERYSGKVVDHFSQLEHPLFENAECLKDVKVGLHLVRALLQAGKFAEALAVYRGPLSRALHFNLEAGSEALEIVRLFVPDGWTAPPVGLEKRVLTWLVNEEGLALETLGLLKEAVRAYGEGLRLDLLLQDEFGVVVGLCNLARVMGSQNCLGRESRALALAVEFWRSTDREELQFLGDLELFASFTRRGCWTEAQAAWQRLGENASPRDRNLYRPGEAEYHYARYQFLRGKLSEADLAAAERLATRAQARAYVRWIHGLRGEWLLEKRDWASAAASLQKALEMAREVGQDDSEAEAGLVLAKLNLGRLPDPQREAARLSQGKNPWNSTIAHLWLALGERERTKEHAIAAYRWAWSAGEPYVHRYYLGKACAFLESLGEKPPELPPHDSAKDEKLPYESEVMAAIEKRKAWGPSRN